MHTPTAMTDREIALGVQPIDELNDIRLTIARRVAPLYALYGPGGTAGDRKKSALADLENSIRAVAEGLEQKMTEAGLSRAALSHKAFKDLLTETERGRAEWWLAEQELEGIQFTINRAQALLRNPEGI